MIHSISQLSAVRGKVVTGSHTQRWRSRRLPPPPGSAPWWPAPVVYGRTQARSCAYDHEGPAAPLWGRTQSQTTGERAHARPTHLACCPHAPVECTRLPRGCDALPAVPPHARRRVPRHSHHTPPRCSRPSRASSRSVPTAVACPRSLSRCFPCINNRCCAGQQHDGQAALLPPPAVCRLLRPIPCEYRSVESSCGVGEFVSPLRRRSCECGWSRCCVDDLAAAKGDSNKRSLAP